MLSIILHSLNAGPVTVMDSIPSLLELKHDMPVNMNTSGGSSSSGGTMKGGQLQSSSSQSSLPAVKPPPPAYPPPPLSKTTATTNTAITTKAPLSSTSSSSAAASTSTQSVVAPSSSSLSLSDPLFTLFYDESLDTNLSPSIPSASTSSATSASTSSTTTPALNSDNSSSSGSSSSRNVATIFAEGNEYLGLISALLLVRGWNHARYLLNLLESYGIDLLNLMRYARDVKQSMAGLIAWYMDELYSKIKWNFQISGLKTKKNNNSMDGIIYPLNDTSSLSQIGKKNMKSTSSTITGSSSSSSNGSSSGSSSGDSGNNTYDLKSLIHLIDIMPTTSVEQLHQLSTYHDLPNNILPLLSYLGYHIKDYIDLFSRLCRLLKEYVKNYHNKSAVDSSDIDGAMAVETITKSISATNIAGYSSSSNSNNNNSSSSSYTIDQTQSTEQSSEGSINAVSTILCHVLLPALSSHTSISGNNPYLSSLLWSILSLLPFNIRFTLYDHWHGGGIGKDGIGCKHNELVLAETIALQGARAELKRLAKENTKIIGRKLTKFTETCPLVVFNYILTQVEAFDNLIPFMVDALKFSTDLAKDVMAYSLIAQLKKGASGDAKLKKGDTHFSQWFSALTKFIGTFFCRYPTTELKGLLHYILHRLSIGDSLDLLVLKELLVIMGSSMTLIEVSPTQLEGLSGGKALQNEVFGQGGGGISAGKGLITASHCNKAMMILRDELMNSSTAIPLLLFIAQIRSRILHDQNLKQIKLISHLYDTCQDVLMQFTSFLVAGSKSLETIASQMPDFSILIEEVGLAVPVAFQLVRPLLRAALQQGR